MSDHYPECDADEEDAGSIYDRDELEDLLRAADLMETVSEILSCYRNPDSDPMVLMAKAMYHFCKNEVLDNTTEAEFDAVVKAVFGQPKQEAPVENHAGTPTIQ